MTTSTTHTTVTDHRGLLRVFASMAGRRFIGVVDGGDNCIELVFDNPRNTNGNLITIYTGTRPCGQMSTGSKARRVTTDTLVTEKDFMESFPTALSGDRARTATAIGVGPSEIPGCRFPTALSRTRGEKRDGNKRRETLNGP